MLTAFPFQPSALMVPSGCRMPLSLFLVAALWLPMMEMKRNLQVLLAYSWSPGASSHFSSCELCHPSYLGHHLISYFSIAALRKNVGFIVLLALLTITFALLAAAEFTGSVTTAKAGGGTGVVTAFVAYYCGLSELLASEELAVISMPLGHFRKND